MQAEPVKTVRITFSEAERAQIRTTVEVAVRTVNARLDVATQALAIANAVIGEIERMILALP